MNAPRPINAPDATRLLLAAPSAVWLPLAPLAVLVLDSETVLEVPPLLFPLPLPDEPLTPAPATEVTPLGRLPNTTVVELPTDTVKYVTLLFPMTSG
jgi:hypothetical protein